MRNFIILYLILFFSCKKNSDTIQTINFNTNVISINVGESKSLQSYLNLNNIDYNDLLWSSSDRSICEIDAGSIKANKPGKVYITATSKNNSNIKAYVDVEVNHLEAQSIKIKDIPSEFIYGNNYKLSCEINPMNSTDIMVNDIVWSSSDINKATIDDSGNITLTGVGQVMLTAQVPNKSFKDEIVIDIKPITPIGIEIIFDSKEEYFVGDKISLKYKLLPETLNLDHYNIKWSEYYPSGAHINHSWIVDENGNTTSMAQGGTRIKAEVEGFNVSDFVYLISNPRTDFFFLEKDRIDQESLKHGLTYYNYISSPIKFITKSNLDYTIKGVTIQSIGSTPQQVESYHYSINFSIRNNRDISYTANELATLVCEDQSSVSLYTMYVSRNTTLFPGESVDVTMTYRIPKSNKAKYFNFKSVIPEDESYNLRIYFEK